MIELAILFRTINLYAHQAHHLTSGATFMQDHAFYADIYAFADDCYDSLIERHIGTVDDNIDLVMILKSCTDQIEAANDNYFESLLIMLESVLEKIELLDGLSKGSENLIEGFADQVEVFIYKIKRRLS